MIYFRLKGVNKNGEAWPHTFQFLTKHGAEFAKKREIAAYTVNGVCDWEFEITEHHTEQGSLMR